MRSSDDEDDEGSVSDSFPVLLGFVSKVEPGAPRLLRHHFPSKAWLEPAHVPAAEQLLCGASGKPLKFLLQVYAPVEDVAAAFHRTVFLFVSPQGDQLHRPGAVRAFRSQLARANPFYAFEPAAEGSVDVPADGAACDGAGGCSEPFPEWELVIDEEPRERGGASNRDAEAPRSADGEAGSKPPGEQPDADEQEEEGDEDDLADFEESLEQMHFSAFTARVSREPAQCLRYCFEDGEEPLWPARQPAPEQGSIPPCARCGAARRFEFQAMPQLLNYLDADADDASALDFGTIAVYSCSKSCALDVDAQNCAYAEEYVYVQPAAVLAGVAADDVPQRPAAAGEPRQSGMES